MDKLAEQLKTDAERIEVQISAELDCRIEASLRGISPEPTAVGSDAERPKFLWWASSLTGIAAALILIAILNYGSETVVAPQDVAGPSPVAIATNVPIIDWKTESAMLTSPLQQELEDLQADIKKAEQKVKQDIGL